MIYYILLGQDLTPKEAVILFLITTFVYLISLTLHEYAHAFVAYKQGDDTAKKLGRMTLNPFSHLDLFGFLAFMFFGIGWAKPVPINPVNFKKYRTGIRKVSLAGVTANLMLGIVSAILYAILMATVGVTGTAMIYLFSLLKYFMLVNSFLIMFNLLPICSFDGFNFISTYMKSDNKFLRFSIKHGMKILLIVLLGSTIIDMITGVDILAYYLSIMHRLLFAPIASLG